ncbi:MAG: isochorismatase family protein [Planctomycetaceae bacterium]|nr:isochorismatase family protein [Planctomycetaceae bacterium]
MVDVQEKLIPAIPVADQLITNCRKLIDGAKALAIPIAGTEQYPRGLGKTVPALAEHLGEMPEKVRFSCAEVLGWQPSTTDTDSRDQIIVAGIEAHVCVQQTVLDLLAVGFRVYVPADAIASRKKLDWKIALDRMSTHGAIITTTESVLFECCEIAGTPEFKTISQLVKE